SDTRDESSHRAPPAMVPPQGAVGVPTPDCAEEDPLVDEAAALVEHGRVMKRPSSPSRRAIASALAVAALGIGCVVGGSTSVRDEPRRPLPQSPTPGGAHAPFVF